MTGETGMTGIEPQPGIMEIAPYVSGESRLAGHDDVLKLSSNENPLGCSPAARAAFAAAAPDLHRYPATDHAALRRAIGEVHGLDPDRIICGVGSDEVLQFVAHAYAGPGDEIITTEHGFSMYPILARMVGAIPVTVPEAVRRIDVDAILGAVTERTRIVFIANPANPTGTMLGADDLSRLAEGLPPRAILVHDGAYTEFADGFDGGASLVDRHPNAFMTRTFSKIHGLGGLRIGWGYGVRGVLWYQGESNIVTRELYTDLQRALLPLARLLGRRPLHPRRRQLEVRLHVRRQGARPPAQVCAEQQRGARRRQGAPQLEAPHRRRRRVAPPPRLR